MPKKKTTIEDLAVMIQRGFQETAHKSDVDKRFDAVDGRLGTVEGRLGTVDGRLGALENGFLNLASDISYLKARVTEIGVTLSRHEEILEEHSEELKWLHKKFDELTNPKSEKRVITYREFSKLASRVDGLERKIAVKMR